MKKWITMVLLCVLAVAVNAVPARRGWQTRTQADGTTIEVQVIGDEFYHYTINREGQQVREINAKYEVIGDAPTAAVAKARHAKAKARRQRKDIGVEPNLAPKGIVILANFSDQAMQSGHTKDTFDAIRKNATGIREACDVLNNTIESLSAISKENANTAEITAKSFDEISDIINNVSEKAVGIKTQSNELGSMVSSYRT